MTVFVPKKLDAKLSFYCNKLKFKLKWYIYAHTTDVVKIFAVIKSVSIMSFYCKSVSSELQSTQCVACIYKVWN